MALHLPSLEPLSDTYFYKSGEVVVHPSAGIAPGVLLQADPDSRIEIQSGVCIGMGSILHAHAGSLVVESGVTIGTGVLLIGSGRVGNGACIGSSTTVLDPSVAPKQVIPPASLVGDQSRNLNAEPLPHTEAELNHLDPVSPIAKVEQQVQIQVQVQEQVIKSTPRIPGQDQLSRLMLKIYPHRHLLSGQPAEE